jgi:hypothetical protein
VKILIEGEKYPIKKLREVFSGPGFFLQEKEIGTINSVGYYHNLDNREVVYILPKVFMKDEERTVFGLTKEQLFNFDLKKNAESKKEFEWARQTSIYFYKSLIEFKKRSKNSSIVNNSISYNLKSKHGHYEYSYVDIVLSFVNLFKKNKNFISYKQHESKTKKVNKANWDKILRKNPKFLTKNYNPIYTEFKNKKKIVDREEELLIYFFSILNHLNIQHNLNLRIDKSYQLLSESQFARFKQNGLSKLTAIKYRYFSDILKKMFNLCELYLSLNDKSGINELREDFINVNNYNLIFEDMIDKLFSDDLSGELAQQKNSLKDLKYHSDGKVLDHIFGHQSILDNSNIFYIGDSKYYKPENLAGKNSQFKQFTYAKNVIQFNIDLLNESGNTKFYRPNIRYRDELTEGYNITPNFFIYGSIDDYREFEDPLLNQKGEILSSFHFYDRLFDRDTLFLHQYKINFLFVLKSYTGFSQQKLVKFRSNIKNIFRNNFLNFFNSPSKSGFTIYKSKTQNKEEFISQNYYALNGKCFLTADQNLLIAKHNSDKKIDKFVIGLENYLLH